MRPSAPPPAAVVGAVLAAALAGGTVVAAPASARTRKPECKAGIQWTSDRPGFVPAYTRVISNSGPRTMKTEIEVTRSRTVSKKVAASVESSVEGGLIAVKASVTAQFGVEVLTEFTTSRGVRDTVMTPPRRRQTYRYGAVTRILRGFTLVPIPEGVQGPPSSGIEGCNMNRGRTVTATFPTGQEFGKTSPARKIR